jgi:cupin fold WbuC family metalloprotein
MNFTVVNDEVLYSSDTITRVTRADLELLKERARKNPRRRVRLCAHPSVEDTLHEMIIVHSKGNYVRPHKHPQKSESFHIIEGNLVVTIFDDAGTVTQSLAIGSGNSLLYYRLSEPAFHTVIPIDDVVVFHETTNGPFDRDETVFAPWAPEEDSKDGEAYLKDLTDRVECEVRV